jgi:hypothetical protein
MDAIASMPSDRVGHVGCASIVIELDECAEIVSKLHVIRYGEPLAGSSASAGASHRPSGALTDR